MTLIKRTLITIYLVIIFLIFILSVNIIPFSANSFNSAPYCPVSQQNVGERDINATSSYDINIFANYSQQQYNVSNIDIELPPNDWNISSIELDFDKISIGQEKMTIEDNPNSFEYLSDQDIERLAMQVRIDELTVIYSVDIFGYKAEASSTPAPIYFAITGWDSVQHEPMYPVYGTPVELNMSNIPGWYVQTFPEPISLVPGDYALVIDGYDQIKYGDHYYWYINNSATGSNLYMSYYERYMSFLWRWTERYEDVFLHRLNRWVNKTFNPLELNMSVIVDNISYPVSNGAIPGTGSVYINNLTLNPSENRLNIPIINNQSLQLNFDFNSTLELSEIATVPSKVQIGDNITNYWYLFPEIERLGCDVNVEIPIPQHWYDLQVYKNGINITSSPNILFIENTLHISNDSINDGADWLISAKSNPKSFLINSSKSIYNPADDLVITIQSPFLQGMYFVQIIDANSNILYELEISVDSEIEICQYLIRNDAVEGAWTAIVFWHNATDAGFNSIIFHIDVPITIPPLDPLIIIIAVISGGLITAVSYGSYKIIKIQKRKNADRNKKLSDKVKDLFNLQYLMVVDKNSSLDLFTHSFSEKKIDLSLVSGFLDAIRSFGIELTESSEQSQIIKLEYHESKIIMSEYKGFRLILIMKDVPSHDFLDSIKQLLVSIDEKFSRFLDNFNGDIRPFKYIERLLIQLLGTSFISALKILDRKKTKLNSAERAFIDRAKNYMKTVNKEYIFVSQLINLKKLDPNVIRIINSLINKRIFEPIISYENN